jgi:hypothetical protein
MECEVEFTWLSKYIGYMIQAMRRRIKGLFGVLIAASSYLLGLMSLRHTQL